MDQVNLYGHSQLLFREKVIKLSKGILQLECDLNLSRNRIKIGRYSYPLHFVIFEHPTRLGYFDSEIYEIGIHKSLSTLEGKVLENTIRHELAHFLTFITHGKQGMAHDSLYRDTCQNYGWNKEVWSSKLTLPLTDIRQQEKRIDSLMQKVQKLLQLAQSGNLHEAALATEKAQELVTKYNLEMSEQNLSDPQTVMKRIMQGKRVGGKEKAIYQMLQFFYVYPVFNHYRGGYYLEVAGSRENITIAHYVCDFLEQKLEALWKEQKATSELKGKRDKNSFFLGIAQGFCDSQKEIEKNSSKRKDLIHLQQELTLHKERVYGRLSGRATQQNINHAAKSRGQQIGEKLQINRGVGEKVKKYLPYWS